MRKVIKGIMAGSMCMLLASCKSVSPEAQAMIDAIAASQQNTEHTVQEYLDIQAQYDALEEEVKEEVSNYAEYQTSMDTYFAEKKTELNNSLQGKKFYFSEKEGNVGVVVFNGDSIKIDLYEFDENGKQEIASVDYEFLCDGKVIRLTSSSAPMEIPYSMENGQAVLDSYYVTEETIIDGLQGDWTQKKDYGFGEQEINMTISGNSAQYEYAAEALGYNDGSYYYYGPYSGTFEINDGSVEINDTHGDDYFFSCYGGSVQLFHYGDKMSPGSGLKGEDGYYDSF